LEIRFGLTLSEFDGDPTEFGIGGNRNDNTGSKPGGNDSSHSHDISETVLPRSGFDVFFDGDRFSGDDAFIAFEIRGVDQSNVGRDNRPHTKINDVAQNEIDNRH
jgi:hypothetical protein